MSSLLLTVSQLNTYIKSLLDGDPHLQSVYVCGEISNFVNHYRSGHFYLSLKDDNAVIQAVMFRSAASRIKFTPQNGMKVLVRGRVSLFERSGQYQIYIDDMQPDGVGSLQLAFEQRKEKLAKEGLFDADRKRPIPKYPARIGVVTSPTGAVLQDIRNVLTRRYPLATLVLCPVLVQGTEAAGQIAAAIRRFHDCGAADVLIVGRGGGSMEDLWAFNEEIVVRAVAASQIPIISAVGHETDFTLCDFAADLRAPTPSAAAELAAPDRADLHIQLFERQAAMKRALQRRVEENRRHLLAIRQSRSMASPLYAVELRRMKLDYRAEQLKSTFLHTVRAHRQAFGVLAGKLDALSPLKVLARGYAIASNEQGLVTKAAQAKPGENLNLKFMDGSLSCRVISREITDSVPFKTIDRNGEDHAETNL